MDRSKLWEMEVGYMIGGDVGEFRQSDTVPFGGGGYELQHLAVRITDGNESKIFRVDISMDGFDRPIH